jgi:hypothetical protein
MTSPVSTELDLIEELRLRRWAREHYAPTGQRLPNWHPVVHEEMTKKDLELGVAEPTPTYTLTNC